MAGGVAGGGSYQCRYSRGLLSPHHRRLLSRRRPQHRRGQDHPRPERRHRPGGPFHHSPGRRPPPADQTFRKNRLARLPHRNHPAGNTQPSR